MIVATWANRAFAQARPNDWLDPTIVVGVDIGVSAMNENGPLGFDKGVGSVTSAGQEWGARAAVEWFRLLAVEARYVGMSDPLDHSVSPRGDLSYVTTGGEIVGRLSLPLPLVHPYVFGGFGYYSIALDGSSTARAASPLFSSSQWGRALGFGLDVALGFRLTVGVEATYRYQINEKFSNTTTNGIDGGDVSSLAAVLRLRL